MSYPCVRVSPETADCPFCGADTSSLWLMWGSISPSESHYYVACFQCMAAGPQSPSEKVALTKWNTAFAVFLGTKKKEEPWRPN